MVRRPPIPTLLPYTTLFRSADPLGALPEIQVGNKQPQRPAVLRTDRLAVARIHEHVLVAEKIFEAQVGGEARFEDFRSEEHTSELQSRVDIVCRLLLEKKKK